MPRIAPPATAFHASPAAELPVPQDKALLLTVAWIACLPTVFVLGNNAVGGGYVLNVDRVFYLIVAGIVAARTVRRPESVRPLGRLEVAMGIYLGGIVLSWVSTLPGKDLVSFKQDADFLLKSFLMPFTGYVMARSTAWTRTRIRGCVWVLVGGVGTYLMVTGFLQYTYGWTFFAPRDTESMHPDRFTGPFSNSIVYGLVVSMLLCLALFLYRHCTDRWERAALLAVTGGLLEAIVFSKARVVWLAVPAAMMFLSRRCRPIRPLAAALIVGLAGQILLLRAFERAGVSERITDIDSLYCRIAAVATAINMIVHKPMVGFGFGLGTFSNNREAYATAWGDVSLQRVTWTAHPHNEFLNVLVLTGIVGLVIYLVLLWAVWQLLSRQQADAWTRTAPGSELAAFVQAGFVLILIAAQFHDVMYMSYLQTLFFFVLGIVASGRDQRAGVRHTPLRGGR